MSRTFEQHTVNLAQLTADELERRANRLLALCQSLRDEAARLSEVMVVAEAKPEAVAATPVAKAPAEPEGDPQAVKIPEQSVGRHGVVTFETVKTRAEELGEFTRAEFADLIGLNGAAIMRWLTLLRDHGVVSYTNGKFRCLNPPSLHHWVIRQKTPFSPEDAAKVTMMSEEDVLSHLNALDLRGIVHRVNGSGMFEYEPPDPNLSPRERPRHLPPEKEPPSFTMAPKRGEPVRKSASDRTTRAQRSKAGAGGIKGPKQRDARYNKMQEAKAARAASSRRAGQQQQEAAGKGSPRSTSKRRKAA